MSLAVCSDGVSVRFDMMLTHLRFTVLPDLIWVHVKHTPSSARRWSNLQKEAASGREHASRDVWS